MQRHEYADVFAAMPAAFVLLSPDLDILDVNPAYTQLLATAAADLVGRRLFEAFPPGPEARDEDGVPHVQRSFDRARATRRPERMPIEHFNVVDPATGANGQRFWSLVAVPVLDGNGRLTCFLLQVEDISDQVAARQELDAEHARGVALRSRTEQVEAELITHVRDLQAARDAERFAARTVAAQAGVSVALAHVSSVEELTEVVVRRGLAVLGAQGGAVAVRDGAVVRLSMSELGSRAPIAYAEMATDDPLPTPLAATTGRRTLLTDWDACRAYGHGMIDAAQMTGCQAWAFLPLLVDGVPEGSLSVGYAEAQTFTPQVLEVLQAFAAQCAQALHRIREREAERESAASAVVMSEALQRSLLTAPVEPDHTRIVVRYRPAAQAAQVGGDWYDAFQQRDGATVVVIGDVIGHDSTAAAAMGQVRGTLRAIGVHAGLGPAELLSATDRVMHELLLPTTATALVARLEQAPEQRERGVTTVRWSSAGHLPAVLVDAGGSVTTLSGSGADLLLGLLPDTRRHDQTVTVDRGATLLLYTDGLVERRGESLEVGLERLHEALGRLSAPAAPGGPGPDLDGLVDGLLGELVPVQGEDDIAVIAVRLHPQDRPRPREAGPRAVGDVVTREPRT